jgi:hypothetical protein
MLLDPESVSDLHVDHLESTLHSTIIRMDPLLENENVFHLHVKPRLFDGSPEEASPKKSLFVELRQHLVQLLQCSLAVVERRFDAVPKATVWTGLSHSYQRILFPDLADRAHDSRESTDLVT